MAARKKTLLTRDDITILRGLPNRATFKPLGAHRRYLNFDQPLAAAPANCKTCCSIGPANGLCSVNLDLVETTHEARVVEHNFSAVDAQASDQGSQQAVVIPQPTPPQKSG
jgi:hypothetical protein